MADTPLPEIVVNRFCPADRVYMVSVVPGDKPGTRKLSVAALHLNVKPKGESHEEKK